MVAREVAQQVSSADQPTTLFTNLDKLAVVEEMRVSNEKFSAVRCNAVQVLVGYDPAKVVTANILFLLRDLEAAALD